MPDLDARGKIAAAELAFYVPIAIVSLLLVIRYAFRRDSGWFFLLWFALGASPSPLIVSRADFCQSE